MRIGQAWRGLAPERCGNVLHGDLRRQFAVHMPAHTVGDQHQQRIAALAMRDPVLVGSARAAPAFLIEAELHASIQRSLRHADSFRINARKSAVRVTSDAVGSRSPNSTFCRANTLCGRR